MMPPDSLTTLFPPKPLIDPYRSESYARCHETQGEPFYVAPWDTWLLRRPIEGTSYYDAISLYPSCRLPHLASIEKGLECLRQQKLVSLTLVTDPFQNPQFLLERASFKRFFKTHYLVDLTRLHYMTFSRHHRYEIRKSPCRSALLSFPDYLEEWMGLYAHLSQRHDFSPEGTLPRSYFEALTHVPQVVAVGSFLEEKLVSMHLWVHDGTHVFSHLAASHPNGYAQGAAYGIYHTAIEFFGSHKEFPFKAMDLGGCAGPHDDPANGLVRFKKGFSNQEIPVYVCGYILDPEVYLHLRGSNPGNDSFFPIYREPRK